METQGQYEAKEKGRERRGLSHKYVSKEQRGEGVNTRKREKDIDIRGGSERYFDYCEPNTEQAEKEKPIREGGRYRSKESFLPLEEKEEFSPFFQKCTHKKGNDIEWHTSEKQAFEKKGGTGCKDAIDDGGKREHVVWLCEWQRYSLML